MTRHDSKTARGIKRLPEASCAIRGAAALALLAAFAFSAPSCSSFNPFAKKDDSAATQPAMPGSATDTMTPQPSASGRAQGRQLGKKAQDETKKKKSPLEIDTDLIEEASLDTFKANFNKEVGRDDPFEPVTMAATAIDAVKISENPDSYRVLGTARTPNGMVALLQIDTETPMVHEGDILDNGAFVKKINMYSVVVDNQGQEVTLVMRTRKREVQTITAQEAANEMQKMMLTPDIKNSMDNLYDAYLKSKFGSSTTAPTSAETGDSDESEPVDTSKPTDFSDFLKQNNVTPSGSQGTKK